MQGVPEDDPRAAWPDPPPVLTELESDRVVPRAWKVYLNLYKLSGRSIHRVLEACGVWDRIIKDRPLNESQDAVSIGGAKLDRLIVKNLVEQVSKGNVAAARELRERQKEEINREAYSHIEINFVPWTTKDKTLIDVMEVADEKLIYRSLKALLERIQQERFPDETVNLLEQFIPLWLEHANTIYYPKKQKTIQGNYKGGPRRKNEEEPALEMETATL